MGFPSPARDYEEKDIDLAAYLVPHPLATYYARVKDNELEKEHIPAGALLVIDRTIRPAHNRMVVIDVNGERKIRRLLKAPRSWVLTGGDAPPVVITSGMTVQIFGVITKVIIET